MLAERDLEVKMSKCPLLAIEEVDEHNQEKVEMTMQQQQLLSVDMRHEIDMMRRREEEINMIEHDVVDLNQMFVELSGLVNGILFPESICSSDIN